MIQGALQSVTNFGESVRLAGAKLFIMRANDGNGKLPTARNRVDPKADAVTSSQRIGFPREHCATEESDRE